MSDAKTTTDHEQIQKWAEARDARPASVGGTGKKGEAGVLRLDFGAKEDRLDAISWDEFFEKFEQEQLAFLHQDKTADGHVSRFHKFVRRD
jgi:hypothetical protein